MPNFHIKPLSVVVFTRCLCRLRWIWAPLGTIGHHWAPLGTILPGARLINIDNKQIKCLGRIRICSELMSLNMLGPFNMGSEPKLGVCLRKRRELPLLIKCGKSHIYVFPIETSIFSEGCSISTVGFRCLKTWVNPAFLSYVKMENIQQVNLEVQYLFIWVCLKIGYIPNEIAIFHRDNDQQNH